VRGVNAPKSLVEDGTRHYGRFSARPSEVNPLDEFGGIARGLRRLRLKEWAGFTLVHPELYSSMILQDANYLASSEIYVHDRRAGTLHQHAANARGGSLALPVTLDGSSPAFERPGYRIAYDLAPDRYRLSIDIAATDKAPAFKGELELDPGAASPALSVSSRLPGGRMYTHKSIFPARGVLAVGDREFTFDGHRDMAILDEHKSFLPYRTNWLWGTFAFRADDGLAGANFADRPEIPGQEEESGIWTPSACEPLADVTFEPASPPDPLAPWRIASKDGRLDVTFEPEGRKRVKHQLGLFAIDYFQLFGHYRGTLRGAARTYEIKDVHGVCESMRARL
jgi:hypothetical protein